MMAPRAWKLVHLELEQKTEGEGKNGGAEGRSKQLVD
jgi:hypothetical protein